MNTGCADININAPMLGKVVETTEESGLANVSKCTSPNFSPIAMPPQNRNFPFKHTRSSSIDAALRRGMITDRTGSGTGSFRESGVNLVSVSQIR